MGIKGPTSEPRTVPKRAKGVVSAAQRKRWQLGSPVTDPAQKGPAARGSCELPDVALPPTRRAARGAGQPPIVEVSAGSDSRSAARAAAGAGGDAVHESTRTSAAQQPRATCDALAAHSPTPSAASDARSPTADESTESQPSGSVSRQERAQVEADISPFRRIQQDTIDRHRANADASGTNVVGGGGQAVEAVRSASQDSADSVDSTSTAGPSMTAQWRSFRQRQKVAAEPEGADTQQSPLEVQREASIALERQGIHAERVGRGGHDPCGITRRIRDVQLDPKAGGIWVDRDWHAAEGVHLTDELVLGKILGSGFQAHVYELLDKEGRVAPIVLKAARKGALISDTQREWATGQRLAALGPGDAPLPGIMKIGPAVCRGRKREQKGTKLMGMVMERINGKSVDKIITAPDFHDIYYIRDMLRQVFTSLDAAQRAFGFHHYDLRTDNVMEHVPDPEQDASDPISLSMIGDAAQRRGADKVFKIIDFGLGRFDEYYAADEGADGGLDERMAGDKKKAPWYTAPIRWFGSAPEAIHQAAWRGKGDVYHLIFDLSQKIHGRVWLEKDRPAVKRLLSLIQHVCGVQPTATFSTEKEGDVVNCLPVQLPVACLGVPAAERRGLRGRSRTFVHKSYLLRWILQLKAWQFPSNPGLTASEVLTSPFFR